MAPPPRAGADRAWRGLALSVTTLTHVAVLGGALLAGDRLLLTRNPALRSFAGLATMLVEGRTQLRGAGLPVRDRCPLGALATWTSWEWFRADAFAQHAINLGLMVALAAALFALLRAARASAPLAACAALALALHPCAADLSAPLAGRDALLALALCLLAARRVVDAPPAAAVAWTAAASLGAGLCAPGYGLLGLVPAGFVRAPSARAASLAAAALGALAALALTAGAAPLLPSIAAARAGNTAALLAWLPSPTAFVALTSSAAADGAALVPLSLAALALVGAARARDPVDASLLRAGAGALAAATLAATLAGAARVVVGAPALALHLGLVLAASGLLRSRGKALAARARPWMLLGFALPAALTAHRARSWADEDTTLRAIVARRPADPEASLARARLALRARDLPGAAPWCLRYMQAQPDTGRADGCAGAVMAARGDHRAAVLLLRRWARALDDRRALRAATLELSDALPDPRLAAAFAEATGFALPSRRPGEPR
ncbi:MAG: hypothetical protein Q7V43_16200 [Myxococcales bacterium]|nr:hypothetical protein [Myxococcales bacterium]